MTYGYSIKTARLNAEADDSTLGVQLGKACIEAAVPVMVVAARLGVSRQTVYNWFAGTHIPGPRSIPAIQAFLASLD